MTQAIESPVTQELAHWARGELSSNRPSPLAIVMGATIAVLAMLASGSAPLPDDLGLGSVLSLGGLVVAAALSDRLRRHQVVSELVGSLALALGPVLFLLDRHGGPNNANVGVSLLIGLYTTASARLVLTRRSRAEEERRYDLLQATQRAVREPEGPEAVILLHCAEQPGDRRTVARLDLWHGKAPRVRVAVLAGEAQADVELTGYVAERLGRLAATPTLGRDPGRHQGQLPCALHLVRRQGVLLGETDLGGPSVRGHPTVELARVALQAVRIALQVTQASANPFAVRAEPQLASGRSSA